MRVSESRRLTGPGPLLDGPGAALEAEWDGEDPDEAIARWRARVEEAHRALGLSVTGWLVRRVEGGATLGFRAPWDRLLASTEINEWAASGEALDLGRLLAAVDAEADPALRALLDEAARRGVEALVDDDALSLGFGVHARVWPRDALPDPTEVEWEERRRVPVALVTGTNGKSTTTRLLARCVAASGLSVGSCTTDDIRIGGVVVERGDWTGPGAARRILRDPAVEAAVLETARGGLLRRGLAVSRADVAVITNVAEDHLGEWGVHDLAELARVKGAIAAIVPPTGWVVLNAEDPHLRGLRWKGPVAWFSPAPELALAARGVDDMAVTVRDGWIVAVGTITGGSVETPIVALDAVPVTWGGAARFNVENALAATAAALGLGVSVPHIAEGLASLHTTADDSPGRQNVAVVGGVTVLLDFGHNPHGVAALLRFVERWHPTGRRTALIGQAGDRSDDALHDLARTLVAGGVSRFVLRPMPDHLRGRELWEVPELLEGFLRGLGVLPPDIERAGSEAESLATALARSEPGDLILAMMHVQRAEVRAFLDGRGAHWVGAPAEA